MSFIYFIHNSLAVFRKEKPKTCKLNVVRQRETALFFRERERGDNGLFITVVPIVL